ncbi:MAG: DNA double-strand break repair nuclease NurA [Thaumarchaeota archaeon]|nr:DNA double-strand break repair nuclease NurA [Nitrososphaerota archaeon]MDE1877083.1 DNA double-strand break repair nuclease NurA [Nitrososphaerota archaeon]
MLNAVYRDAIEKREAARSVFRGEKFDHIIKTAKENWIEYTPQKKDAEIAGIDSSYNSTKFQGLELWVVTGVSVKSDGQIITENHRQGLGQPAPELEMQASKMEVEACINSVDKADLVALDGSLYSQFLTRQASLGNSITSTIKKRNNVIFISKTSSARKQFEKLGSVAGDIFYYNHAIKTPGFSKIFVDTSLGPGKIVSYVYARLRDSTPLIKIELLGSNHMENEIKLLLDMITKNSVGGYPYSLKLAHENCKITSVDLARLVSLYGLGNEIGSREVLN